MDITKEQVNKIFELASMKDKMNNNDITSNDISNALLEIESKLYSFSQGIKVDSLLNKKILIADDLELSIYQLSTVLKKIGLEPNVARHKEEALAELQKSQFDCIIVDLFMPDSNDGLEIIKAAIKKREEYNSESKIVVISGTDDFSLINKCYELGIDFYIQKDSNWHSKLLKFLTSAFQKDNENSFTGYAINNEIMVYSLKRFNEKRVFDSLIKNINSAIYTGIKHILLEMKDIMLFDTDNAYIFADIYKLSAENGGKLIIINPTQNVKEAMSFAFLEDIIPTANSIEEAVKKILNE